MSDNILIINSNRDKSVPLADFFKKLENGGNRLYLFSAPSGLLDFFAQNNWTNKKILFGPFPYGNIKAALLTIELPFLTFFYFFYLSYLKYKKNISAVICSNFNEKIIFAPIARLLKLKMIWLELPDTAYIRLPKALAAIYKSHSKHSQIVVFNNKTRIHLQLLGIDEEKINFIPLGVESNQHKFQANIFNELAQTKNAAARKYFTIGTLVDLNSQQNLKSLFGAIKICLNVIPDIQLVIIGDGEKRKDLIWLAKKMEIDNYVWFVGEQAHLKKWLDNFHIFAVSSEKPKLNDFSITLKAMHAALPIIGISNLGLEDLIESAESPCGILTDNGNNEELAQSIIKLQQNESLREEMGRAAKERVEKSFTIERMAKEFKKLLV